MPFTPLAMLAHRGKNPSICYVNIQKLLQLEGTIGPPRTDPNKNCPLPNL
jgi:hypothetical protein